VVVELDLADLAFQGLHARMVSRFGGLSNHSDYSIAEGFLFVITGIIESYCKEFGMRRK
jgi:hypothetical protein